MQGQLHISLDPDGTISKTLHTQAPVDRSLESGLSI